MKQNIFRLTLATFSSLMTFFILGESQVKALTINRQFLPPGTPVPIPIPGIATGNASENVAGNGNLIDIFNTAADSWETAIQDEHTINIFFGWLDLGAINPSFSSLRSLAVSFDTSFPATTSFIAFNNNSSIPWFLDSTPTENEEYQTFVQTTDNLGGGEIEVGRVFSNPVSEAVDKNDLLTIATRQIAVSLGFLSPNPLFGVPGNPKVTFPSITTTSPRPFAGTIIPTNSVGGASIDIPTTLLAPTLPPGIRKLPSGIDILAVAEVNDFTQIDLNYPRSVPESSSVFSLLTFGTGIILLLKQKHNKQFYK